MTVRAELASDGRVTFLCPGCDQYHCLPVGEGAGPRWGWNGSLERPTLTPSILARWSTRSEAARARNDAFRAVHGRHMTREELPPDVQHICHSYVTDGRIQFLNDCTHELRGQTVDLPPWTDT